jgi:TonB-linked SusC/RagA family outer membrane protein
MKKKMNLWCSVFSEHRKTFMIMRISLFLILISTLQILAVNSYSQSTRLTLDMKNVTIKDVLSRIEEQSDFYFLYDSGLIDVHKKVDMVVQNEQIDVILNKLFGEGKVNAVVRNRHIILTPVQELVIQQQSRQISGKVTDTSGAPLLGVSVVIKGTTTGMITDADGNYSLPNVPGNATLTFSFVGMKTQEVIVGTQMSINVTMEEETIGIEEIVAIGYGTVKKSDLTGSVSSIKMSDMGSKHSISVADYLMGGIPGLNISKSSSTSGQTSMEIRGPNSISASTQPLLVVDGIIYDGNLNELNPSDIESVDVLKDASSAAVYGSKAASGVVIITTKRGKSTRPVIMVDAKLGIQSLIRTEQTYDVDGYLNMRIDAMNEYSPQKDKPGFYNNPNSLPEGVDLNTWLGYTSSSGNVDPTNIWLSRLNLYAVEIDNYLEGKSVDWYDEVFRTGIIQDYNVSLSGKTDRFNYYWSVGYMKNQGVVYHDSYSTLRSRINLDGKITDFLKVGVMANLTVSDNGKTPASWESVFSASPLGDMYDADGSYTINPNGDNMSTNPFDPTKNSRDIGAQSLVTTTFAHIYLPFGFTYEANLNNRWGWSHNYLYQPANSNTGQGSSGIADRTESRTIKWSIDNILRWNKTIKEVHRFDVTLLYNAEEYNYFQTVASATNFSVSEELTYHGIHLGGLQAVVSNDEVDTAAAMMARLNYAYKNKYLFTYSFRRDGFSAFGQANPWANFHAAATAWTLSEEKFMLPIKPVISNLKLRVSIGQNGNSDIGRYSALSQLTSGYYIINGATVNTFNTANLANADLCWEKTSSTNFGLDFGLFDGKLSGNIDTYLMKTKDLLLTRQLPTTTGYDAVIANLGQLNNKGLEVSLNSLNISNENFRWSTKFNFSMNRNEIVHLYGEMVNILDEAGNVIGQREADDISNGWYIGHALDGVYDYKVIGIWQKEEAEEAAKYGKFPGDFKMLDKNNDYSFYPDDDKEWLGYTKPRYRFNMRNNLTLFKNFDISFQIRANLGHIKNSDWRKSSVYTQRISQYVVPYWTEENRSNLYTRVRPQGSGTPYNSAAFCRIDDFSVSYRIPKETLGKYSIESAKLSFSIDNVYSFDKWERWDPETNSPTPTVFTFGVNLTL